MNGALPIIEVRLYRGLHEHVLGCTNKIGAAAVLYATTVIITPLLSILDLNQ